MTDQVQSPLFQALADLSFDSVMVTEPTDEPGASRIVFVNRKFTELTGYGADEVVGETPGMLQGARTDPEVIERLADDLRRGRSFHGQTINYRKDGTPFEIEWKVTPVLDDAGKATHYVAVQRQAGTAQ
ncbi:MAG: PAS domain-containing protein [Wenzhouxiangellaceae bacterium]|nr:PAS domain-containing protein [Wenzhouxiangellaceae bacterium]